jgi:hypothetical protein
MAFYASSEGLTGPDVLKKARELLTASEAHGEYYIDGGEFLPLSVWGRRGFDEERILLHSLPADVREDRVLGTTYRVKVLSTGNRGEAMTTRTTQCKRKSSALPLAPQDPSSPSSSSRPRLALEDGPAPAAPPGDTSTPHVSSDQGSSSSSSDSSSDTSSSSSSSSGKHKKKGKKGKKGKKVKKGKKDKKNTKDKRGKKCKKEKKSKKDEHRGT